MYLFIDTETTGLPDDYNSLNSYNNVRLVQIAWIIYDSSGRKISKRDFLIKPVGFVIPENSTKIHNISNSLALIAGKSIHKVLLDLNDEINSCSRIVAHNLKFDFNVLLSEFNRSSIDSNLTSLQGICTMNATTDFCAIQTSKGYKWPTLAELYRKTFHQDIKEIHNAALDIEATAKCFWYLKKNNLVDFEKYIIKDLSIKESKLKPLDHGSLSNNHPGGQKIRIKNVGKSKIKNMNLKENAISLRSYCESIKDGDSVSQKQLDRLFQMIDDLIVLIETEDSVDEWQDLSPNTSASDSSYGDLDDLPF